MTDLFHWLSIVNWPGALIVVVALVVCSQIIIECYGRNR